MLSHVVASGKCRTESSLMTRKTAFRLQPLTILPPREAVVHLSPISSFRRTVTTAWVNGNHGAANAKLDATQRVVMFRIVSFVRQNPARPQMDRRLSHGRSKIWGILARTKTGNGSDDQLRSGVENGGQFGPRRVLRITRPILALEVDRNVSRFQACSIDRRRIAGVFDDQTASPATVAASCQQSLKSPFSRSFCSTCHNVE